MPLPRGFVPPCLPTKAPQPPSCDTWVHEIKHDGFRVIARKKGAQVGHHEDRTPTHGYAATREAAMTA
jgi:hypothetical protein